MYKLLYGEGGVVAKINAALAFHYLLSSNGIQDHNSLYATKKDNLLT